MNPSPKEVMNSQTRICPLLFFVRCKHGQTVSKATGQQQERFNHYIVQVK